MIGILNIKETFKNFGEKEINELVEFVRRFVV
jgi:hypothetical protein